jgi:multimeric flavodoxin WrbA
MRILGFMGSPRTRGLCAQFTESVLKGAASMGAEIKQFNLVKYSIKTVAAAINVSITTTTFLSGAVP